MTAGRDVLVVPGWTSSGPEHWQSVWQRAHPSWRRVEQRDWERPDRDAWVATLDRAIASCAAPPLLVAHSLGTLTVVLHATTHASSTAAGAFLVAPPDVEREDSPAELCGFAPVPLERLPFPALVVASRNDPFVEWQRAVHFAESWGATLHDAGQAGHVNTAAGFGEWPDGERLFAAFAARCAWDATP